MIRSRRTLIILAIVAGLALLWVLLRRWRKSRANTLSDGLLDPALASLPMTDEIKAFEAEVKKESDLGQIATFGRVLRPGATYFRPIP